MDDFEVDGARERDTFAKPRRRVAAVAKDRIEDNRAPSVPYAHNGDAKALFFFFPIIRAGRVKQLHGLRRHYR